MSSDADSLSSSPSRACCVGDSVNVGGNVNAGAVNVLYGSVNGLTASQNDYWSQDSPGIDAGTGAETGGTLKFGL